MNVNVNKQKGWFGMVKSAIKMLWFVSNIQCSVTQLAISGYAERCSRVANIHDFKCRPCTCNCGVLNRKMWPCEQELKLRLKSYETVDTLCQPGNMLSSADGCDE